MSQQVGLLMIVTGTATFFMLALKLLFQPFIPEGHYINDYFPSTELVLGVPILCGTAFFVGFGIVVHTAQALKFAIDICRGMAFLHTLDPLILRFYLSSMRHVMIDEELTARINMADAKFSFQEKGKMPCMDGS